jgi:hypothetical protein
VLSRHIAIGWNLDPERQVRGIRLIKLGHCKQTKELIKEHLPSDLPAGPEETPLLPY